MIVKADGSAISMAARILRDGGLVAFPTETVYGLGADATNGVAVARIFEAKGRPRFNPLIVHLAEERMARDFAGFNPAADMLAAKYWPGPLTLVLPLRPNPPVPLSDLVTAGLETVALRVPAHPVAQALLREAGVPIAAPSANISGRVSPTEALHVFEDLGDKADLILDAGPAQAGLESTIISLSNRPTLLRAGAVSREEIEDALGVPLASPAASAIQSPGQLESHYAPRAALRMNATEVRANELMLAFGPEAEKTMLNLSPSGDLREAAANLFSYLRLLDARRPAAIAVMPIPETGLGEAINDRLRRAAAPREGSSVR
jgi:L-threonylcarbamoyladenylate synthase